MGRLAAAVSGRVYRAKKLVKTDAGIYMLEAIVYTSAFVMVGNNINLFAKRMGASDYTLGLFQFAPHLAQMLILLPGGIFADSLASKKKLVLGSLLATAALYAATAFTPLLGGAGLMGYLALYSVSMATATLYGLGWNSFFTEVIPIEKRNDTLSLWFRANFLLGIMAPLATGFILSSLPTNGGKIAAHQAFFLVAAGMIVAQVFVLNRLKARNPAPPIRIRLDTLKKAAVSLAGNRKFLFFCAVILVFYIGWQMDWTLYFIGETRYLGMNEALLGFAVVGNTLGQFLTLKFWTRMNERHGVVFPLFFAMAGMILYPPLMIFTTGLPQPINRIAFLAGYSLIGMSQTPVSLNVLQCMLQVLPDTFRTISISIFTMLGSFTNAVMPLAGVALYNRLGADLRAMRLACLAVLAARTTAALLWLYRWYVTERRKKIKA